jgi:hypothetical protein
LERKKERKKIHPKNSSKKIICPTTTSSS